MIDTAIDLLPQGSTDLGTDAAVRHELERLSKDVRRYRIVVDYDPAKAARVGAEACERADRINGFLKGSRCGGHDGRLWLTPTQVRAERIRNFCVAIVTPH